MRVLHVIASMSPMHGGTTSAVAQLVAGLEEHGATCDIATSDDDGSGRRLSEDAPERQLPGRYYFRKRHHFYSYTPDFGSWLNAHVKEYHLIHIHGLFCHVNGIAGRVCRRHGVPYVVTPHGMANRYGMRHKPIRKALSFAVIERALLRGAALVHLTSLREECDFAALDVKAPSVRIPLAVAPIPQGNAGAFHARHPEADGRRIAVFMGRLNPIKNLEAAIEALSLPGGRGFHLAVCGDGPEEYTVELKARAETCGVSGRISWLGFIQEQHKADALAAGTVYVQPSLSESFGIAAVEALSAGLPCVLGQDVAIATDLVEAGFAISVPPTGRAVSDALGVAVALAERTASFSSCARHFVEQSFSSEKIAATLLQHYLEVVRCQAEHSNRQVGPRRTASIRKC